MQYSTLDRIPLPSVQTALVDKQYTFSVYWLKVNNFLMMDTSELWLI